MGTRDDVARFLKTLILGDFVEEQSTSAQIIGGLISMIPVLDQLMDVRDIAGALFQINKCGGFGNASSDQLVNLGFAAFGAIPAIGSAFKTVFKPLWKERRAVKGAVNGGVEAVEVMLKMKKGSAIKWITEELLAKWSARTMAAIAAVEAALLVCIEMLDFIAKAEGWKDWLIPDPLQELAQTLLPGLKKMQSGVRAPLQRASDEILAFLTDLLGEQAAAILMGLGMRVATNGAPGKRTQSGNNHADIQQKGIKEPNKTPPKKVSNDPVTQGKAGQSGNVYTGMQRTKKAAEKLANNVVGLVGEHMVDYYELNRLGGAWQKHDAGTGSFNPSTIQKINCDKEPVHLSLKGLPGITVPGIDAVWQHPPQQKGYIYTVTEAKASINPKPKSLNALLGSSNALQKGGMPVTQMSWKWVKNRAKTEKGLLKVAKDALQQGNAIRHVVLVTPLAAGAPEHMAEAAPPPLTPENNTAHTTHGMTKDWWDADIDKVENARNANSNNKKPTTKPTRGSNSGKR
jgi:hypothetical protein